MYVFELGDSKSHAFRIDQNVYSRHAWQPVLEYYHPVMMCHMRVNEKYRVWHDYCHLDDALMAPTDLNHFDGYQKLVQINFCYFYCYSDMLQTIFISVSF